MTDWTTIRVRKDARDAAAEQKPEHMTWSEFITDTDRPSELDEAAVAERIADDLLAELPPALADELR